MKKGMLVLALLSSVITLLVLADYISSCNFIKKCNRSEYPATYFSLPLLHPSYEKDYNIGTAALGSDNYGKAVLRLNRASRAAYPEEKDCDIRLNFVLAYVKDISVDEEDMESIQGAIRELQSARGVLLEKECAREDGEGHDFDAQTLLEEIDAYIDDLTQLLEELQSEQEQSEDDKSEETDETEQAGQVDELDDALEQLNEIEKQGVLERNKSMDTMKYLGRYEYFHGKSW